MISFKYFIFQFHFIINSKIKYPMPAAGRKMLNYKYKTKIFQIFHFDFYNISLEGTKPILHYMLIHLKF